MLHFFDEWGLNKKYTNYFLNQARAHSWPKEGQLWARAWFTEIVFVKMRVYLPTYVCLSVRTHVTKNV